MLFRRKGRSEKVLKKFCFSEFMSEGSKTFQERFFRRRGFFERGFPVWSLVELSLPVDNYERHLF